MSTAIERQRIDSVDLVRGIIMILMALDHTRDYIGDVTASPTNLATTTAALFMTRWITHFCAPTFSLLTGVGAFLMLRTRTTRDVAWFLFTRGLWLILLELTVMRFLWQFNVDYHLTIVTVLWALGWSMVVLSGLIFLPASMIAVIAVGLIALHNMTDGFQPPPTSAIGVLWTFLHRPGPLFVAKDYIVFDGYPLVPWIAVMALGFVLGNVYVWPAERRRTFLVRAGLACVAAFVLLRAANLYGDPRPWTTQSSRLFTLLSFINTNKQPPSLLFLLMTLGPTLLALRWFDGRTPRWLRPAVTIGRVPMFYYLAHVALLHVIVVIEAFVRYGNAAITVQSPTLDRYPFTQPPGWPASLPMVYASWMGVVVLLYPLCRWYARFKATHSSPLWSYL